MLAQHLRRCDKNPTVPNESSEMIPKHRPRTKKACDECAKSKSRCDSQDPCSRCSRQHVPCKYTRDGPLDLYRSYRTANIEPTSPTNQHTSQPPTDSSQSLDGSDLDSFFESAAAYSRECLDLVDNTQQNETAQSDAEVAKLTTGTPINPHNMQQVFCQNGILDEGMGLGSVDLDLRFEGSSALQYFDMFAPFQSLQSLPIHSAATGSEWTLDCSQ